MNVDSLVTAIFGTLLVVLFAVMLAAMFVYLPVALMNDAECLRQGYPKGLVSITLERYCTNLDGAVTVKVDKQ